MSCILCSDSFPMACKGHFSRPACIGKHHTNKEILHMKHLLNSKRASCLETAVLFCFFPSPTIFFSLKKKKFDTFFYKSCRIKMIPKKVFCIVVLKRFLKRKQSKYILTRKQEVNFNCEKSMILMV